MGSFCRLCRHDPPGTARPPGARARKRPGLCVAIFVWPSLPPDRLFPCSKPVRNALPTRVSFVPLRLGFYHAKARVRREARRRPLRKLVRPAWHALGRADAPDARSSAISDPTKHHRRHAIPPKHGRSVSLLATLAKDISRPHKK